MFEVACYDEAPFVRVAKKMQAVKACILLLFFLKSPVGDDVDDRFLIRNAHGERREPVAA